MPEKSPRRDGGAPAIGARGKCLVVSSQLLDVVIAERQRPAMNDREALKSSSARPATLDVVQAWRIRVTITVLYVPLIWLSGTRHKLIGAWKENQVSKTSLLMTGIFALPLAF